MKRECIVTHYSDREKIQKKIERGRIKVENHPYRGGGIANFNGSWLVCRKEILSLRCYHIILKRWDSSTGFLTVDSHPLERLCTL